MHSKPKNLRLIPSQTLRRQHIRVNLEENIMEARAEVRAIYRRVAGRLRVVQVLTSRAVELHGGDVGRIVLTCREQGLSSAENARAFAEFRFLKLVELCF